MDHDAEILLADLAEVPPGLETVLLPRLHPEEQARCRAFSHAPRRRTWLAGRELLLSALARVLPAVEPKALRTEEWGGVRYEAAPLFLNLSHSGDLLAAVLSSHPIGVDLEQLRPRPLVQQTSRVFSPLEDAWVEALPEAERLPAFYKLWTLKEAAAKAAGLSMWEGLRHARFDMVQERVELEAPFPAGNWTFLQAGLNPDWCLALAWRGLATRPRIACHRRAGRDAWIKQALARPTFLRGVASI